MEDSTEEDLKVKDNQLLVNKEVERKITKNHPSMVKEEDLIIEGNLLLVMRVKEKIEKDHQENTKKKETTNIRKVAMKMMKLFKKNK